MAVDPIQFPPRLAKITQLSKISMVGFFSSFFPCTTKSVGFNFSSNQNPEVFSEEAFWGKKKKK